MNIGKLEQYKETKMKPRAMSQPGILIVEDDALIRDTLVETFEQNQFEVSAAESAEDAEQLLEENPNRFDIVLTDIMLPNKSGLELSRALSIDTDIGIILISAKSDEIDRIIGLSHGADDYIPKPFNAKEVLLRTQALYRRLRPSEKSNKKQSVIQFGPFKLNLQSRMVVSPEGEDITLTSGEFQLLSALVKNAGEIMSRDQLLNETRNRDWNPTDRTIDVLIGRLRKKLGDNNNPPQLIKTVRGIGYRLHV